MFADKFRQDVVTVLLRAQNAVITFRMGDKAVRCECYENSARASDVLATKGGLVRHFPAHAVSLPCATISNAGFHKELFAKLCILDSEEVKEMAPGLPNAGNVKDSTDPSLVTDMLMALLASVGQPVGITKIIKRTRDEVICRRASHPWRRSPLWLAVRVTIQTTLLEVLGQASAWQQYKNFMIFFLGEVASKAMRSSIPGDLCHIALAKIARRAAKLGDSTLAFVSTKATEVCTKIHADHDRRWQKICQQDGDRATGMGVRSFRTDTILNLQSVSIYVESVLDRDTEMVDSGKDLDFRCPLGMSVEHGLPSFLDLETLGEEKVYVLSNFEQWVSTSLDAWTMRCLENPQPCDCLSLADIAETYYTEASEVYKLTPVLVSGMILVIARLWFAMDQIATSVTPLLKQYSPEVDPSMFETLLLPKRTQMQALHTIESHLAKRHCEAKSGNPSIFFFLSGEEILHGSVLREIA